MSTPYSFALVIRDSWSAFWRAASEGWEVVASPLVAESNARAETAARSGEIVAVCGVLSRADFTCQEGAVDLDIAVELASPIGPGWQKLLGQLKECHFASTIVRRYRTDPPSNSAGNPMAIRAIVSVVRTSI